MRSKKGQFVKIPFSLERARAKFLQFADVSQRIDSCWLWTGSRDANGYGRFRMIAEGLDKSEQAHRLAFRLYVNPEIPSGMCICHKCDNPSCVNPNHLFLGTHRDNTNDKVRKGRQCKGEKRAQIMRAVSVKGEAHYKAKLTDNDVREICRLRESGLCYREIAEIFNVDITTPHKIVKYGFRSTARAQRENS
jgi:hypothetical protein